MLRRARYLKQVNLQFEIHSVCAILGGRQVGKTTLAHQFAQQYSGTVEFFDLENPEHLQSLETPMLTLKKFPNTLVVIDEIQRRPELFPILRVLVDDPHAKYRYLILGSASRDLIQQSSETLAGRIGYIELPPFTLFEVDHADQLLLRGGFPRSYLAASDEQGFRWRQDYIQTFLERDLPSFGFDVLPPAMHKFWVLLCAYHGQVFNASEIAQALMLSDKTVTKYLHILAGTFMVRILQPWFQNIKKRQVRSPKIYIRDSGIYNTLSSIRTITEIAKTPRIGSLWEGFAIEQIITCLDIYPRDCYFWSTHSEAELDLFIFRPNKRIGFEVKYADAPKITKSMHIAIEDLKLDHLYIIYPGTSNFPMSDNITACGLESLHKLKWEQ